MSSPTTTEAPWHEAFQHEALFYRGEDEFLTGTLPFIRAGVAAGEAVLVVVAAPRIEALRAELDRAADTVSFADMAEVGKNPARIIPAWRQFLDTHGHGTVPVRGIGEPIWASRSANELVECQRHETLLNVAFASSGSWRLLCPYDVDALQPAVIEEAERSHPLVSDTASRRRSSRCRPLDDMAAPFSDPLPEPPPGAEAFAFHEGELRALRGFVAAHAHREGLPPERVADFVLAANEVATNSLEHGGGGGELRLWSDGEHVICEIRDEGRLGDPLVGRRRPLDQAISGRGLWIANQLCDLVQIRSFAAGNVTRLLLRRSP
jgi:anti-sigma regulatory factor (Ser/Thr protein kinase)